MISMLVSLFQTLDAIRRHEERMHHGLVLIPEIKEESLLMGTSAKMLSPEYTVQMAIAFRESTYFYKFHTLCAHIQLFSL